MGETTKTELKSVSRLIVKNLPKHYTEERFRSDFAKFGDVTDTKIMRRDGRPRLFGFVGFKTAEVAEKTKSYFDATYIDTSKISVAAALPPAECPRAWSKYSKNTRSGLKDNKILKKVVDRKPDASLSFDQFLNVVKRLPADYRSENKDTDDDSDEYFDAQTFLSEKPSNLSDSKPNSNRPTLNPSEIKTAAVGEKSPPEPQHSNKVSEKAELKPNILNTADIIENDAINDRPTEKTLKNSEAQSKSVLLVLNTPYSATAEEIREFFSAHGVVGAVDIPSDRLGRPKGFCFVHFARGVDAERLLATGGNVIFQGRLLTLKPALESSVSRRVAEENLARAAGIRPRNFEREGDKMAIKKAKISKESRKGFDWVKIFLRPDAVADAMAAELKVDKSEAVKLALGETRLIEETKKFLISRGVNSDLFENKVSEKRHQTAIFVKNLPFSTTVSEIRSVFQKFGSVLDVLIPPSRSIALVNFASPVEATAAFNGAAFKKFKGVPLFLDWAPENVFGKAVQIPVNETKIVEQFIPYNDSDTLFIKNCFLSNLNMIDF